MAQVILVRGKVASELPWKFFHFAPDTDPKPAPIDVVYFDYPQKKRTTWKQWTWERGKGPPAAKPDEQVKIEPRIFIRSDSRKAIDTSARRPSIIGLYDYVKAQPPGSIAALHFFTHGWWEGPVLWADCVENLDKNQFTLPRDEHDTEPRLRDFFGKNPLAGGDGRKFVSALAGDALVKLWGCDEEYPYREPMLRYLKAPAGAKGEDARKQALKDYLAKIEVTYIYQLASRLGITVWATPVGWGTNPWEDKGTRYVGAFPPDFKKKEHWWHAPNFDEEHQRFYRDVLKAPLDATRYVGYKTSWFRAAKASLEEHTGLNVPKIDSPRDLQDRIG